MDELSISIGNRIKDMRIAKGKNQSELARGIKTISSTVAWWESGRSSPGAYSLIKLANYFGCTTDEILGRTP